MSAPFFSVVIATYNRADLVGSAIRSVFAQTFQDFHIVVVDDGSADGTSTVVQDFVQRYPGRIEQVRQETQGVGVARNTGVARARGKYVAFLDSDDLWYPWTLETIAATLARHAEPAILIGT